MQLRVNHTHSFKFFLRLSLYFILVYYLLMQFNFTLISHNFGFRKKHFLFEKLLLGGSVLYFLVVSAYAISYKAKFIRRPYLIKPVSTFYVLTLAMITQFIFLLALVPLVNYNFYLDSFVSVSTSSVAFTVIIIFFLIFFLKAHAMFIGSILLFTHTLQGIFTLPLRAAVSYTWLFYHFATLVYVFVLYFYVNKSHSWFSLCSYSVGQGVFFLPCHCALFFSELTYTELFKKIEPSKVFKLVLGDKTAYQLLLTPPKLQSPELLTLDYSIYYLSHVPVCLCAAYAVSLGAVATL